MIIGEVDVHRKVLCTIILFTNPYTGFSYKMYPRVQTVTELILSQVTVS